MDKYDCLDEEYEAKEEISLFSNNSFKTEKQYVDNDNISNIINYMDKIQDECYIEEDDNYNFKVNKNKALKIALTANQLLSDYREYTKNYDCESLDVLEKYVDLVSLNDRKYWLVQIIKELYMEQNTSLF